MSSSVPEFVFICGKSMLHIQDDAPDTVARGWYAQGYKGREAGFMWFLRGTRKGVRKNADMDRWNVTENAIPLLDDAGNDTAGNLAV